MTSFEILACFGSPLIFLFLACMAVLWNRMKCENSFEKKMQMFIETKHPICEEDIENLLLYIADKMGIKVSLKIFENVRYHRLQTDFNGDIEYFIQQIYKEAEAYKRFPDEEIVAIGARIVLDPSTLEDVLRFYIYVESFA